MIKAFIDWFDMMTIANSIGMHTTALTVARLACALWHLSIIRSVFAMNLKGKLRN